MTRPKYKALYLHNLQAAGENLDRAKRAEQELARLRSVLSTVGEDILLSHDGGSDPIELPPLGFECSRAFMEAHQRCGYENGGFSQNYTWRGRPVYMVLA